MEWSNELFVALPSGCRICYQTLGNPKDDAILVIQGHSTSMTQKSDDLLRLLCSPPGRPAESYFIIRFDHRDTGRSTSFSRPAVSSDGSNASRAPLYTLTDMVDDIVGLIHHLDLTTVHLVGMSLGSTLAWQTAVRRLPSKTATTVMVKSLALVFTSPVGRQQRPSDNLPPLHLEGQWLLGEAFTIPDDPESNDDGWIAAYTQLDLALATQPPTDAERAESRHHSDITYRREKQSGNMWTKFNHSDASGVRWPRELLREVRCPTVVVHAEKDQLFPLRHAEAVRDDVPGGAATLVVLEDCGHELPQRVRGKLAGAILDNARIGQQLAEGR
ncbi:hypothetical protein AAL_05360 [Moelleriella libera RCEF 2490]|uniref:AB hydrolase-1 domain-containing protein n=1 Tax=Moelleriella libera RCEF 2490 TaxID=1081109 RepID=A0A162IJJ5_9HYPO|nr:hypothetical protein AAL_05360 [Moelleriella libera RCEF 2490]